LTPLPSSKSQPWSGWGGKTSARDAPAHATTATSKITIRQIRQIPILARNPARNVGESEGFVEVSIPKRHRGDLVATDNRTHQEDAPSPKKPAPKEDAIIALPYKMQERQKNNSGRPNSGWSPHEYGPGCWTCETTPIHIGNTTPPLVAIPGIKRAKTLPWGVVFSLANVKMVG
jgi:hypothetical protein